MADEASFVLAFPSVACRRVGANAKRHLFGGGSIFLAALCYFSCKGGSELDFGDPFWIAIHCALPRFGIGLLEHLGNDTYLLTLREEVEYTNY